MTRILAGTRVYQVVNLQFSEYSYFFYHYLNSKKYFKTIVYLFNSCTELSKLLDLKKVFIRDIYLPAFQCISFFPKNDVLYYT